MASYPMHDFTTGSIVTRAQLDALGQGLVAFGRLTSDQGTDDSLKAPSELSATATVLDSRAIEVTFSGVCEIQTTGAGLVAGLYCNGGAVAEMVKTRRSTEDLQDDVFCRTLIHFPGASGDYTYSIAFWRGAGTGNVTIFAGAQMIVKDVHGV